MRKRARTISANMPRQRGLNAGTSFGKNFLSKKCLYFFALMLFAFCLNRIETTWGLTGFSSWQPDTIEGYQTAGHMKLLFSHWQHKYPRGQFLINWLAYRPLINHWEKNPVTLRDPDNSMQQSSLTVERLKVLAGVSRWIVAVMSLGTIAAVFLTTLYLFGDYLSAWLAAFILSASCLFVFYSSIGHLDVPFTFWYAWAGCFCVLAVKRGLWRYYIPAALCAAYAVCTKEGYSMYIVGLAAAYCILKAADEYEKTRTVKGAIRSVFSLKAAVSAAVFAGLFLLMSGFLGGTEEFITRMKFMSSETLAQFQRTQLELLRVSFKSVYLSVGWPVLLAAIAGIIYLLFKNRAALLFILLPVVVFYLLTVTRLRFSTSRYFVPASTGLAILAGYALANGLRAKQIRSAVRYGLVFLVGGLTTLYSAGLQLEMKQDTRIRAEAWVHKNVDKKASICAGMYERYGPRLSYEGYKMGWEWHSEGMRTRKGLVQVFPDYLIMGRLFPCGSSYKDDTKYKAKLYAGQAGYKQAACFRALYFYPSWSIAGTAAWPYKPDMPDEWVSPEITIFKKE
ncbi:MAG: glycosyltransferase family 39 protein [Planctomycetaceae bacterium]|nr:glycosyltransferase family 39 protein [Planctomycetaceae bacterium]